jgi:hypothetical protein
MDMLSDLCGCALPVLLLFGVLGWWIVQHGPPTPNTPTATWEPQTFTYQSTPPPDLAQFQEEVERFRRVVAIRYAQPFISMRQYEALVPPTLPELPDPLPAGWREVIRDLARIARRGRGESVKPSPFDFGPRRAKIQPTVYVKQVCSVCSTKIEDDEGLSCAACYTPHHHNCWDYLGQCGVFGCACDLTADLDQASFSPGVRFRSQPEPEYLRD